MNNTSLFQAMQYQYNNRAPVLQYNTNVIYFILLQIDRIKDQIQYWKWKEVSEQEYPEKTDTD